ncbi:16445_t:CDS:2, partial [Dentiscutata heterogama]
LFVVWFLIIANIYRYWILNKQTKFDDLSTQLVNKMEDMDSRIDVLQKSLETLMQQADTNNLIVED